LQCELINRRSVAIKRPKEIKMIINRSAPTGTVVPHLIYEDVGEAIEWLCGAFSFKERLRVGGPDGKVGHAQLSIGGGSILLGPQRVGTGFATPDRVEFRPPHPHEVNQSVNVRVEDVDRHFEHAKRFGARILNPPTDYPYGERQYSAEDPAGHHWTFSQSIADVDPQQWGATIAKA
jgi:uncharacterized glyoxalase superfamily protein PhnB